MFSAGYKKFSHFFSADDSTTNKIKNRERDSNIKSSWQQAVVSATNALMAAGLRQRRITSWTSLCPPQQLF